MELKVAEASSLPSSVAEASRLPKSFKIGEGWDYNPGKAFLSFDDTFDGNFKINPNQPNYKDFGRPSVKDVKDRLSNFDLEHLKHFYEKRDGRERYAPYIKKLYKTLLMFI